MQLEGLRYLLLESASDKHSNLAQIIRECGGHLVESIPGPDRIIISNVDATCALLEELAKVPAERKFGSKYFVHVQHPLNKLFVPHGVQAHTKVKSLKLARLPSPPMESTIAHGAGVKARPMEHIRLFWPNSSEFSSLLNRLVSLGKQV